MGNPHKSPDCSGFGLLFYQNGKICRCHIREVRRSLESSTVNVWRWSMLIITWISLRDASKSYSEIFSLLLIPPRNHTLNNEKLASDPRKSLPSDRNFMNTSAGFWNFYHLSHSESCRRACFIESVLRYVRSKLDHLFMFSGSCPQRILRISYYLGPIASMQSSKYRLILLLHSILQSSLMILSPIRS